SIHNVKSPFLLPFGWNEKQNTPGILRNSEGFLKIFLSRGFAIDFLALNPEPALCHPGIQ
ncbi:MAG: hypothetical protein LBT65_08485, partial [Synergistaceae bacterium]|nr:hypothetical protein [Synergistaceae bacterium]